MLALHAVHPVLRSAHACLLRSYTPSPWAPNPAARLLVQLLALRGDEAAGVGHVAARAQHHLAARLARRAARLRVLLRGRRARACAPNILLLSKVCTQAAGQAWFRMQVTEQFLFLETAPALVPAASSPWRRAPLSRAAAAADTALPLRCAALAAAPLPMACRGAPAVPRMSPVLACERRSGPL